VQVTGVVPIGKLDPLTGAQATVTGAAPPVTIGAPKFTVVSGSDVDTICDAGQARVGGVVVVCPGAAGELWHPQKARAAASSHRAPLPRPRLRLAIDDVIPLIRPVSLKKLSSGRRLRPPPSCPSQLPRDCATTVLIHRIDPIPRTTGGFHRNRHGFCSVRMRGEVSD